MPDPQAKDNNAETGSHISVCICTFKRPQMLSNLIGKLQGQVTENLFTYSAVVVDNDINRSAEDTVKNWQEASTIPVDYHSEPEQNIALARNKAVDNATGNFIAFIDDDEVPETTWLLRLYKTLKQFKADAVLGPVRPHYPEATPAWLIKSNLCERPSYKTGTRIPGRETRTGNVLLDGGMFENDRFDRVFGRTGSEDTNFFRMMEKKGKVYVWCEEAPAYEIVPPERWSPEFYLTRSSRIGRLAGARIRKGSLLNSAYFLVKCAGLAAALAIVLPFSWLVGKHISMRVRTRLAYNLSLISSLIGGSVFDRDE